MVGHINLLGDTQNMLIDKLIKMAHQVPFMLKTTTKAHLTQSGSHKLNMDADTANDYLNSTLNLAVSIGNADYSCIYSS